MASKSSQPALYEKMRNRAAADAPVSSKVDLHPASVHTGGVETGGHWLGPGRAIRLPTGYILLACGIAVLLLSLVYVLGHKRGAAVARDQFEQQVLDSGLPAVNDPLQPMLNGGTAGNLVSPGSGSPMNAGSLRTTPASSWGPVKPAKDPRQKGLNYFILAETHESGAIQLAEFCRSHGLETYVLAGNNKRLRVVAFPGFVGKERSSAAVKAMEAQILDVGEKWKRVKGMGNDNLQGFYPSLYNG